MSDQQTPPQPEPPAELWMLWCPDSHRWVVSFDEARDGITFLVCMTAEQALRASSHQNDLYDLECVPVRVK
jgi:hypothetical protein